MKQKRIILKWFTNEQFKNERSEDVHEQDAGVFNAASFRTMVRLFEKCSAEACAGYGFTRAEIDVLSFLKNNPELDTAREIVEYRNLSKAGVSQAVEQLIQKGMLTRRQDEKDRRQIHLQLTEAAQPVGQALDAVREEMRQVMFDGFTPEEEQLYLQLVLRTHRNAKKALEKKHWKVTDL